MSLNILETYSNFFSVFAEAFPPSSKVDLMLLLLDIKPCLRTKIQNYKVFQRSLVTWCQAFHLHHAVALEDFFYLSRKAELVDDAIQIDHSSIPHEKSFGYLMGYPQCCCEKIALIGEENIDLYESTFAQETFEGEFALINPLDYRKGKAFISHVPCSSRCLPSVGQAKQLAHFLLSQRESPLFTSWINVLKELNYREERGFKNIAL